MIRELLAQTSLQPEEALLALELFTALRGNLSCDFSTFLRCLTEGRKDVGALIAAFSERRMPITSQVGLLASYLDALEQGANWSPLEFWSELVANLPPSAPPPSPPPVPPVVTDDNPPFEPGVQRPLFNMPQVIPGGAPPPPVVSPAPEPLPPVDLGHAPVVYEKDQRVEYSLGDKRIRGVIGGRDTHGQYDVIADDGTTYRQVASQYLAVADNAIVLDFEVPRTTLEEAQALMQQTVPVEGAPVGGLLVPVAEVQLSLPQPARITVDILNDPTRPLCVVKYGYPPAFEPVSQVTSDAFSMTPEVFVDGQAFRIRLIPIDKPKRTRKPTKKVEPSAETPAVAAPPRKRAPRKKKAK